MRKNHGAAGNTAVKRYFGVEMTGPERKNFTLYIAATALTALCGTFVGSVFGTSAYVQSFLLELSAGATAVGNFGMVVQVAGVIGYLMFAGFRGDSRRDFRLYLLSAFLYPLAAAGAVAAGLLPQESAVPFICLCVFAAAQSMGQSLNGVGYAVYIKRAVPATALGTLAGIGGAVGGLLGVLFNRLAEGYLAEAGFPDGYLLIFGVTTLLSIPLFICLWRAEPLYPYEAAAPRTGRLRELRDSIVRFCTEKATRRLILPCVLRGGKMAALHVYVALLAARMTVDAETVSALALAVIIGNLVNNLLFAWLVRKVGAEKLLIYGAIAGGVGLCVFGFAPNIPTAFVALAVLMIGRVWYDQAFPTAILLHVPQHLLPAVTSVRQVLLCGTMALCLPLYGRMIDAGLASVVVILASSLWILIGWLGWRAFPREEK